VIDVVNRKSLGLTEGAINGVPVFGLRSTAETGPDVTETEATFGMIV
jgi:hypothetical protein